MFSRQFVADRPQLGFKPTPLVRYITGSLSIMANRLAPRPKRFINRDDTLSFKVNLKAIIISLFYGKYPYIISLI